MNLSFSADQQARPDCFQNPFASPNNPFAVPPDHPQNPFRVAVPPTQSPFGASVPAARGPFGAALPAPNINTQFRDSFSPDELKTGQKLSPSFGLTGPNDLPVLFATPGKRRTISEMFVGFDTSAIPGIRLLSYISPDKTFDHLEAITLIAEMTADVHVQFKGLLAVLEALQSWDTDRSAIKKVLENILKNHADKMTVSQTLQIVDAAYRINSETAEKLIIKLVKHKDITVDVLIEALEMFQLQGSEANQSSSKVLASILLKGILKYKTSMTESQLIEVAKKASLLGNKSALEFLEMMSRLDSSNFSGIFDFHLDIAKEFIEQKCPYFAEECLDLSVRFHDMLVAKHNLRGNGEDLIKIGEIVVELADLYPDCLPEFKNRDEGRKSDYISFREKMNNMLTFITFNIRRLPDVNTFVLADASRLLGKIGKTQLAVEFAEQALRYAAAGDCEHFSFYPMCPWYAVGGSILDGEGERISHLCNLSKIFHQLQPKNEHKNIYDEIKQFMEDMREHDLLDGNGDRDDENGVVKLLDQVYSEIVEILELFEKKAGECLLKTHRLNCEKVLNNATKKKDKTAINDIIKNIDKILTRKKPRAAEEQPEQAK